jgi:hypothetical protein
MSPAAFAGDHDVNPAPFASYIESNASTLSVEYVATPDSTEYTTDAFAVSGKTYAKSISLISKKYKEHAWSCTSLPKDPSRVNCENKFTASDQSDFYLFRVVFKWNGNDYRPIADLLRATEYRSNPLAEEN